MKCRTLGMKSFGIEDIPKLHENENGEKQRQFVRRKSFIDMAEIEEIGAIASQTELAQRCDVAMLEILDKTEKHNHEEEAHAKMRRAIGFEMM